MEKTSDHKRQQLTNRLKTAHLVKQQIKSRLAGEVKAEKQERIELAFYKALLEELDKHARPF